ncbi:lipid A deacylase LpxR family protein [Flavobacterium silvaticum]|uniref:Lipid A deacylase LpxR family protein n=1 Tax=Flavobacterium silvaticum TaxID=1852020 RepID=A0A972JF99_9FLAO|nr:lipid A deacylase LpxR family protein [Flavobacterium silvaticum]NMH27734.1 lipid A deacylase LpxR family protein [Flavobacterium silvaticum]
MTLLLPLLIQAQKNEGGIVLENDLFTSTVNDKYYTNGIEFYYRYVSDQTSEKTVKSTNEFRIGQYIYNPQTVDAADPNYHDRPFAGLLSAQYTRGWFYKSGSVLKLGTTLGIIGPESGAEKVQENIHKVFNYKPVYGWKYQIKSTPVIEARFQYIQQVASSNHIDLGIQADAMGGTAFSSISAGLVSRMSLWKLVPRYESVMNGAAVSNESGNPIKKELFFYISPGVNYQFYDATIQGSPFNDDSPLTWDVVPVRFIGEAGIKYRAKKICLSYAFVYRGKEADNWVNEGYFYGSISASYLF